MSQRAELTEALDVLRRTYAGRPLDDIKTGLIAIFEQVRASISEPDLTEYAPLIQADRLIEDKRDGVFDA